MAKWKWKCSSVILGVRNFVERTVLGTYFLVDDECTLTI